MVSSIAVDLPEGQCGFRTNGRSTDIVFVLRQLQEKCREHKKGLYVTFGDLTKSVWHGEQKRTVEDLGATRLCPPSSSAQSSSCTKTSMVKSGSTLTSYAFYNHQQFETGLRPGTDSLLHLLQHNAQASHSTPSRRRPRLHLLPPWRQPFQTQATSGPHEDHGATDPGPPPRRRRHTRCTHRKALQRLTSCFAVSAELFGLEITKSPWRIRRSCTSGSVSPPAHQNWRGWDTVDKEIDNRLLAKANNAFWSVQCVEPQAPEEGYQDQCVQSHRALMYGSESWVTYRSHLRLLERFHQRCLGTILNIHWNDFVTNVEFLEQAELSSIEAMLLKSQLH